MELPFAVNNDLASSRAINKLSALPLDRAIALYDSIKTLKSKSKYFSVIDILDLNSPPEVSRVLKATQITENAKPLELRNQLWQQNPDKYTQELARDNKRQEQEAKQRSKLSPEAIKRIREGKTPKDGNFKLGLREFSTLFDPISGVLLLPSEYNLEASPFAKFYDNNHKIGFMHSNNGVVELRGETYYLDREPLDFEDKLTLIQNDFINVLDFVANWSDKRPEMANSRDYLLYLGALDLMKHHSLTLFHTLTYNERLLQFPEEREEFYKYQEYKQQALQLMKTSVRMFYQTLFGVSYDPELNLKSLRNTIAPMVDYIKSSMNKQLAEEPDPKISRHEFAKPRFTEIEVNNPITIALGAQEAAKKHPDIDMIVGIPSGGTEVAIVTQLIYELNQDKSPQLVFIPISFHGLKGPTVSKQEVNNFIGKYYKNTFADKVILLIDDNSEAGLTLKMVSGGLLKGGASEIKTHLVELSLRRLIDPKKSHADGNNFYNPEMSDSTLGLTSMDPKGRYASMTQRFNTIKRAQEQSKEKTRW